MIDLSPRVCYGVHQTQAKHQNWTLELSIGNPPIMYEEKKGRSRLHCNQWLPGCSGFALPSASILKSYH
jgi:hypothetical protein